MSTKIASLYAEIGADTTKLEAGLKRTKGAMKEAKQQTETFAESIQKSLSPKSGYEFGNIRKDMDGWVSSLKGATSRNEEYAVSLATVTDEYKKGNITAD